MNFLVIVAVIFLIGGMVVVGAGLYYGPKIKGVVDKLSKLDGIDLDSAVEAVNKLTELAESFDGLNMTALELLPRFSGLMNEFNISSFSEIPNELTDEELRDFVTRFCEDDNLTKDS